LMANEKTVVARFFQPSEQEIQIKALAELADGCRKHPSYRCRRKPAVKCVRCSDMYDLKLRFEEWQMLKREAWKLQMEADRQRVTRGVPAQRGRTGRPTS